MRDENALTGYTRRIKMGCGNVYITINLKDEKPIEIFTRAGKAGGCQGTLLQGIGRLTSNALQDGMDVQKVIDTLKGLSCHEAQPGPRGTVYQSCLDAMADFLREVNNDSIS